MQMSKYVRLSRGLADKGSLIKPEDIFDHVDSEKDYYTSVYYYNDNHFNQFKERGTVKGIKDVLTNKIWFDFDLESDVSKAQVDAQTVVTRLKNNGIKETDIEVYFSGNKGFNVVVTLNRDLNPDMVYSLAVNKFGKGLDTLDTSMYDSNQILRVPGTRHNKSNLYKIPLTVSQLNTKTVEEIKVLATSLDNVSDFDWGISAPKEEFFNVPVEEKKKTTIVASKINFSNKNPQWRNCKWSLLQGNFNSGQRHSAMMVVAATARGLGFDETTAVHLCLSAAEKQAQQTGQDSFPIEEIEKNIIPSIYNNEWEGGQYTCEKPGWLQTYCQGLGEHKCNKLQDDNTIEITDAFNSFKDFAQNIDALTINTGIPSLDKHLRMTIGMSIGLVASPGAGKTSISLQILNNMSKRGEQCVFFSYDMYHALVLQKLIQKHFKLDGDDIFNYFKEDNKEFEKEVLEVLNTEYKNVAFCFKTGQSPDQMIQTVKETQEKTGKKVRLVIVDYSELVQTEYSDSTASSAFVAQKLREMATTLNTCVITLLQPNKASGNPSDELTSYRSAKGSSSIEQALSVMLGISRPGYNPKRPDEDIFLNINCLKNRMGRLFSLDLHWEGLTGEVRGLSSEESELLNQIRTQKEEEKESSKGSSGAWN